MDQLDLQAIFQDRCKTFGKGWKKVYTFSKLINDKFWMLGAKIQWKRNKKKRRRKQKQKLKNVDNAVSLFRKKKKWKIFTLYLLKLCSHVNLGFNI